MSKDYYSVLGISKTANVDEIRKAYKIQARKWHPDCNKDNTTEAKERFQNVGEAFEVLSDADKRMRYDLIEQQAPRPYPTYSAHPYKFKTGQFYAPYTWPYSSTTSTTSGTKKFKTSNYRSHTDKHSSDNAGNSGDNGTRFTKSHPHHQSKHNSHNKHNNNSNTHNNNNSNTHNSNKHSSSDHNENNADANTSTNTNTNTNTNATSSNNINGINKDNINSNNSNSNHDSIPQTKYYPTSSMPNPPPQPIQRKLCITLEDLYTGTTKRLKVTRRTRLGTKTDKILSVEIKPGTKSGSTILFPGEGDEMADGQVQDIEFTIEELENQSYSREDDNLHATVNITLVEALVGFSKEIKALDQTQIPLKSNTTIQPGQRIRMNRKGMPNAETGRKGDLLVTYNVILPNDITDDQKQQIADAFPES
ncbi:unnamed protein product [Absidia cylindrospora]